MQIEEVLIVINNSVKYGIDTSVIEQILHVPDLTAIPYAPKYTRGLCSISGAVVNAIDFSLLLGDPSVDIEKDNARAIVMSSDGKKSALLVSQVVNSITLDPEMMELSDDADLSNIGTYKHEDGLIQIIDIFKLFEIISAYKIEQKDVLNGSLKDNESSAENLDKQRYLLFLMGSEQFALKIDFLQEIISVPEAFTDIAGSQSYVSGIISLRDALLIVNDIRKYYNYKVVPSDKNKILVTDINHKKLGLIVDEIIDIRDFDSALVDEMPVNFQDDKLSGVIHNDEQLISIVGEGVLSKMIQENDRFAQDTQDQEEISEKEKEVDLEVLVFKLHDTEYAFNIDHVDEIIDMTPITKVAETSEIIDGLINIRGKIVTIASLYKSLGLEAKMDVTQKILICEIDNNKIGFNVDIITDVMGVHSSDIKPDSEENSYFSNILHLDGGERLVLMIDIEKLMKNEETR